MCTAPRTNVPNAVCSPSAFLLDPDCLLRTVSLLGVRLAGDRPAQAAKLLAGQFQALHTRCGAAASKVRSALHQCANWS